MKKSLYYTLLALTSTPAFADTTGLYVGGGAGYGMQSLSISNATTITGTPTLRGFVGYQLASWMDAEAGYTYISQATNWNNLGTPSTTIYDLAFLPGVTLPLTPVTIYARLGVDAISANLNSSWYNQVFSELNGSFEWGLGVKVEIPGTRTFVRAEYTDYGTVSNNNNSNLSVTPSTVMISAGYVF